MTLIYAVETERLTLDVSIFLILRVLLLGLDKGNSYLVLPGNIPKFSVLSNFCDTVVQQFHVSQEVLRVPVHDQDIVGLDFCPELFVPQVVCSTQEHSLWVYFSVLEVCLNLLFLVCSATGDIIFFL